jgi:hypothetical protein
LNFFEAALDLPHKEPFAAGGWRLLLSTHPADTARPPVDGFLRLRPNEAAIWEKI